LDDEIAREHGTARKEIYHATGQIIASAEAAALASRSFWLVRD
jgi:hypothetical protein